MAFPPSQPNASFTPATQPPQQTPTYYWVPNVDSAQETERGGPHMTVNGMFGTGINSVARDTISQQTFSVNGSTWYSRTSQ